MVVNQDEIDFDEDWYLLSYRDVAAAVQARDFASGLQHYQLFGRQEGRKAHGRAGKIAIVTMVYNENIHLPIWLKHYRRMAPNAALFVIDHSSDDGSTDNLAGVHRILLPRDRLDEDDRVFFIGALQQGLLRYYEVVIYTDCDELLVPDPARSASLEAHLGRSRYPYASPVGINVIHDINSEPAIDFSRPLLRQRRYGQFHSHMCKPLVSRIPLAWEAGFHVCDRPVNIDRALYLFHIKQIDQDQALQRHLLTRRFPWSRHALEAGHSAHHRFDVDPFIEEFFVSPAAELQRAGAGAFVFEAEIARLQRETRELSGVFHTPQFRGPIVEIPEIWRSAF